MTPCHLSTLTTIWVDNLPGFVDTQQNEVPNPGRESWEALEVTTTTITLPEIAQRLRDKRDGGPKTVAAREIGVSRQIYGAWEGGFYTPGDEWAEKLAAYLNDPLPEIVWVLYQDRMNRHKGVYVRSLSAHMSFAA